MKIEFVRHFSPRLLLFVKPQSYYVDLKEARTSPESSFMHYKFSSFLVLNNKKKRGSGGRASKSFLIQEHTHIHTTRFASRISSRKKEMIIIKRSLQLSSFSSFEALAFSPAHMYSAPPFFLLYSNIYMRLWLQSRGKMDFAWLSVNLHISPADFLSLYKVKS
jgi:hypothetical protein